MSQDRWVTDAVVLEHLAASGWFMRNGEVALTTGLTFCLNKDHLAAAAFVDLIRNQIDCDTEQLPLPDRWVAEWIDEDGKRPDIVGWRTEHPQHEAVLFIEAKVSAAFAEGQISHYLERQRSLLCEACAMRGALVLLVPDDRLGAAHSEVERQLVTLSPLSEGRYWSVGADPQIIVTAISWADALHAMGQSNGPAADDIRQLAGAARVLRAPDVTAITGDDLKGGWRDRTDELKPILDDVTKRATETLVTRGLETNLLPWQPRSSDGLLGGYRYIGEPDQPNLAMGMPCSDLRPAAMRAKGTDPPFWLRWHRATTDASKVSGRLRAAGLPGFENHGTGLVWLPLQLEPDVGVAERQTGDLIDQVVEAYLAARQPTGTSPQTAATNASDDLGRPAR